MASASKTARTGGVRESASAIPAVALLSNDRYSVFITAAGAMVDREFFDYVARGAPFGSDHGTVAPWVVVASLPFAPEIVVPPVRNFARMNLGMMRPYGFKPSFNQTYAMEDSQAGPRGEPLSLRRRSRTRGADDRKLSDRLALEYHAPM